jgi:hypothetical protein
LGGAERSAPRGGESRIPRSSSAILRAFGGWLKAFILAVETAAILLLIEPVLFGQLPVALPALPKVAIEKVDPDLGGYGLTNLAGQMVLLLLADQKGGGEGVIFTLFRHQCRLSQSLVITEAAALALPKDHPAEELRKIIPRREDHSFRDCGREFLDPFPPEEILRKGVNIRVVEIPIDRMPLPLQYFKGVGSAGTATDMEENFHEEKD